MEKLTVFLFWISPFFLFGQQWTFGPFVKANWASQTYTNPDNDVDETFKFGSFLTIGAGVFGTYHFNTRHSLETRLGYLRKGNVDEGRGLLPGQNPFTPTGDLKNKFDCLSLDLVYYFGLTEKSLRPIIGGGIQNSLLLGQSLGSDIEPYNFEYPFDRFEKTSSYSLAYLLAVGIEKQNSFSLVFEFNRDLVSFINKESLWVRDILFSLQLNVVLKAD
jgi:hypothetical protein